ncbi:MAG: hypothetical protein V4864_16085 [Pseudomonadota bacterium]
MTMQREYPQSVDALDSLDDPSPEVKATVDLPSAEATLAAATEACEGVSRHFSWVGPLVEAALLCPTEERHPVKVYTKWGGDTSPIGEPEDADADKHESYSDHMLRVIHNVYPWLLPLLDSAKATLLVYPGTCCFTVHSRLGFVFDIPPLIPLTQLTPFPAEAGETLH